MGSRNRKGFSTILATSTFSQLLVDKTENVSCLHGAREPNPLYTSEEQQS